MLTTYPNPSIFEGLSEADLDHLTKRLHSRQYNRGQVIFATGQPADYLYLLQEGLVKITYIAPGGDHKILEICEAGDIFGELFLGKYRYRIGYAEAMTPVQAALIAEETLYDLIHQYSYIAINYIRQQADAHRRTMAHLHALQRMDARARLLGVLLSLTRTMCCQEGVIFELNPAITQQDIADIAGLNRSTVSWHINRLRDEGILGGNGRQLTVNSQAVEDILWADGFELLE